jgi:WD40 repeat protein/beta-lactamase regulating signal transducer with metallopeptidase domain
MAWFDGLLTQKGWTAAAVGISVQICVLFAAAAIFMGLLRRHSAAIRHRIWCLTFGGALISPWVAAVVPSWEVSILPPTTPNASSDARTGDVEAERLVREAHAPLAPSPAEGRRPRAREVQNARNESAQGGVANNEVRRETQGAAVRPNTVGAAMVGGPALDRAVLVIWVAGVILSSLPLLRAEIDKRLLARKGRPRHDSAWDDLLGELRHALRISRAVRLCVSADDVVPMTWGVWRPVILLPSAAASWSHHRRRVVLLHELAHIKRLDLPLQWLARVACVLYWFHPFVWYGLYRLRIEREEACDDCVLRTGQRASDYAAELIAIAKDYSPKQLITAIAMARSLRLEGRVRALLDGARSHGPVSRAWSVGSTLAAMLLILCTATLHPVRQTASADEKPAADDVDNQTDEGEDRPSAAAVDALGDRLPEGALLRLGTQRFRHPGSAYEIAVSPDERTLVTFGNSEIVAWDAATGRQRWQANTRDHRVDLPNGPAYGVHAVAFTPDSKQFYTPGREDEAIVWDVDTGRQAAPPGEQFRAAQSHSVDLTQDGELVALGSATGIVVFSTGGQLLYEIANLSDGPLGTDERDRLGFFGHYSIGLFSPDGAMLAVVTSDTPEAIRLHEARTGQEIRRIPLTARVVRFAFSPDGSRIATTERDRAVRLYDVETADEVWSRVVELDNPFENYTSAVAYSPDGQTVAAGATDFRIYLFDAATGEEVGRLTGHRWYPWGLAFTVNGKVLYSTGWDGSIRRWDIAARKQLPLPTGVHATGACAASSDGDLLAYVDDAGTIRLAAASDGAERDALDLAGTDYTEVAFSPGDGRLAGGGTSGDDVHVAVWDVAAGKLLYRWDWPKGDDPHSQVEDLDFAPDGKHLAAAVFRQSTVYVWDLTTGEQTAQIPHGQVYGLSFSPDGQALATAGWDSVIRFWDVPRGELQREYRVVDEREVDLRMYAVEYAPENGILATAHMDGRIRLWDAATTKLRAKSEVLGSFAYGALDFSPDGQFLATGTIGGAVSLWSSRTGEKIADVGRHDGYVYTVDFGRDSGTLLSGGRDGACYVWDLQLDQRE